MAGFDHEAVKAEDQLAGARLDQPRTEQRRMFLDHRRVEIGKELARGEKRALVIGDAGDLEIADAGGLHLSSLAKGAIVTNGMTVAPAGRR